MSIKAVRFARDNKDDFSKVLRTRVMDYFKENNISKHANATMVFKTIFMIALYFVPFILVMTEVVSGVGGILGMYAIMGLGLAGIGLSIMHDANHGAYSKHEKVNDTIGRILNVVGGFAYNWKVQHNVLHHTFTNVEGYDEDIAPGNILRFSPHAKRLKHHKYQHYYAWFFYGLMTFLWITVKDFNQLKRYKKKDLIDKTKYSYGGLLATLIAWKIFYYAYIIALPIIVLDEPFWVFPLGVFICHFISGIILAMIFQPAHVVPHTDFPLPEEPGNNIDNMFMKHQLETTANFAPKAKLFSWYVGGLNYQVEHHLFPNICHVHYPKLAKIVKATAEEYGIPYHSFPTFRKAIIEHTKMLKQLGTQDEYVKAA